MVGEIAPNSTIELITGVPFDANYENTMYFADIDEQDDYFEGQEGNITITAYSYQRTDKGSIRIGNTAGYNYPLIKNLYNCNYMRFKNTEFENKWFYAFIDSIEYINNNCVEIFYHIDVIQTWLFQLNFNQCMIERCHVPNDTPGMFTYPEQIEHGPYVNSVANTTEYKPNGNAHIAGTTNGYFLYTPAIVLVSTVAPTGFDEFLMFPGRDGTNCKTYSGAHFYKFSMAQASDLSNFLDTLTGDALIDSVLEIMMIPNEFLPNQIPANGTQAYSLRLTPSGTINGYTPRNKKLLCYPYNMIYCTNNQGTAAEYRLEDFVYGTHQFGDEKRFYVWGNVSTSPSMMLYPFHYKQILNNFDEKITVSGFPICAWKYDSFKAWLAQNAGSIGANIFSLASNTVSAASKIVSGSPGAGSATAGVLNQTAQLVGEVYDHSRQPPQSRGSTDGSFQYSAGLLTFTLMFKQIKREYAQIIDGYFDMYGYKIMMVGTPTLNVRPCYTYVKTIGCDLNSDIPANDERKIEEIFNNGIRFWKSTAVFGSYDPSINNNTPS